MRTFIPRKVVYPKKQRHSMCHPYHPQDETTARVVTLGPILGLLAFLELLIIFGIGWRL